MERETRASSVIVSSRQMAVSGPRSTGGDGVKIDTYIMTGRAQAIADRHCKKAIVPLQLVVVPGFPGVPCIGLNIPVAGSGQLNGVTFALMFVFTPAKR